VVNVRVGGFVSAAGLLGGGGRDAVPHESWGFGDLDGSAGLVMKLPLCQVGNPD